MAGLLRTIIHGGRHVELVTHTLSQSAQRANENRSSDLRELRSEAFSATRSDFISTGLQPGDQKRSIEIETVSTVSPAIHR
jgi:hypothetical protein